MAINVDRYEIEKTVQILVELAKNVSDKQGSIV